MRLRRRIAHLRDGPQGSISALDFMDPAAPDRAGRPVACFMYESADIPPGLTLTEWRNGLEAR